MLLPKLFRHVACALGVLCVAGCEAVPIEHLAEGKEKTARMSGDPHAIVQRSVMLSNREEELTCSIQGSWSQWIDNIFASQYYGVKGHELSKIAYLNIDNSATLEVTEISQDSGKNVEPKTVLVIRRDGTVTKDGKPVPPGDAVLARLEVKSAFGGCQDALSQAQRGGRAQAQSSGAIEDWHVVTDPSVPLISTRQAATLWAGFLVVSVH